MRFLLPFLVRIRLWRAFVSTETDGVRKSLGTESISDDTLKQPVIDPDFSPEIVADLYRHRPRHLALTFPIALFLGPLGGHRFYLGYFWSGVFMFLSVGGGLVWWIADLFSLRRLVDKSNETEREREKAGLPPRAMGFLPPRSQLRLDAPPAWAPLRAGRRRVLASAILLATIGFALGVTSSVMKFYEPIVVLCLFVLVSVVAARTPGLKSIPGINALVRWVHRLRLFYYTVDPGSVWAVVARPTVGILFAPWRLKVRAEVRLHLQMGGLVVLIFSLFDALELVSTGGLFSGIALLLTQFLQTILCTYLFVAPASALITTQLLLEARDSVVWILSAVTLLAMWVGFS